MKKTIQKFILLLSSVVFLNYSAGAQATACQYTTCPPGINFNSSDLLQIYAAVITGAGASTATYQAAGNVGGYTTKYTRTIETTGAYISGDCVGGVLTFSDVLRSGQTTAILQDLEIWDNNAQTAALTIDIWAESPAGTFTDNAPTVLPSSPANYLGTVLVSSGDYVTTGTRSRAIIRILGITLKSKPGATNPRNIYFTITTTGTPTYGTNTSSLYLFGGFLLD